MRAVSVEVIGPEKRVEPQKLMRVKINDKQKAQRKLKMLID